VRLLPLTLMRVAWRNLWRNPRRTLITMTAMSFGLAMMVMTVAMMAGFMAQMERYATILGPGHIQVHAPKYLAERSIYDSFPDPARVLAAAGAAVKGDAAPRAYATALVSSGKQSGGARVWGIDPAREGRVTEIARHLAAGRWLGDAAAHEVVLGTGLARTLGVAPGDEVVVLTQAADGSLGNALFRVAGVLRSLNEGVDRGGVIMHLADLDALAALEGKAHEVVVRLDDPRRLEEAATALSKALEGPLEVRTWRQLMPEIDETLRMYGLVQVILLFIIFGAAALIIMDTQLMALFERTREIGVVRALGMGPLPVALLLFAETSFLVLLSAAAGMAGGLLLCWLMKDGVDLSWAGGSFTFNGVVFEPKILTLLTARAVILPPLVMAAVTLLATVFPVVRAVRITPVAAIHGHAGRRE
jgi:ABC-type lipoprotein release transport system permease subunit